MKVYRIKHKETGLFYQPIKGRFKDQKTNLGPNGKVYIARKPTFKDLTGMIAVSKSLIEKYNITYKSCGYLNYFKFNEEDFVIIEYDLSEGREL